MDWKGSVRIGRSANCVGIKRFTLDWHGLTKLSKDWRIGELVTNCRNGPGLVMAWQLVVQN